MTWSKEEFQQWILGKVSKRPWDHNWQDDRDHRQRIRDLKWLSQDLSSPNIRTYLSNVGLQLNWIDQQHYFITKQTESKLWTKQHSFHFKMLVEMDKLKKLWVGINVGTWPAFPLTVVTISSFLHHEHFLDQKFHLLRHRLQHSLYCSFELQLPVAAKIIWKWIE